MSKQKRVKKNQIAQLSARLLNPYTPLRAATIPSKKRVDDKRACRKRVVVDACQ